jgi:hypothetical protein
MKMTDEKYKKQINDFFGDSGPQLGTSKYTADQCVGFVRKLLTGQDPYADRRMTYDDTESLMTNGSLRLFEGDLIPYIYLQYNVLRLPPSVHGLFWETSNGKLILKTMFQNIQD